MYTFCPTCSTVFAIKAEHLLAAAGRVRCGTCGQVFRAFDYVYEDLDTLQSALAGYHARQTVQHAKERQDGSGYAGGEVATDDGQDDLDAVSLDDLPMPAEFADTWSEKSHFGRNLAKGALIGVLLLILGVQWLYFNRTSLAAQNDWRPGLELFCSFLRCELPLQVDLSRIELVSRDVRKHPRVAGALLINASLVNRADFRQPYPILEVTFSNSSGIPVAVRRFHPDEYLGNQADIKAGMPVDTQLHVMLEIEDPGEDAVSFEFEFL
ncbi:MAG: DUF3426 domain-containing protein [Gammaproteobacteria bacterium]